MLGGGESGEGTTRNDIDNINNISHTYTKAPCTIAHAYAATPNATLASISTLACCALPLQRCTAMAMESTRWLPMFLCIPPCTSTARRIVNLAEQLLCFVAQPAPSTRQRMSVCCDSTRATPLYVYLYSTYHHRELGYGCVTHECPRGEREVLAGPPRYARVSGTRGMCASIYSLLLCNAGPHDAGWLGGRPRMILLSTKGIAAVRVVSSGCSSPAKRAIEAAPLHHNTCRYAQHCVERVQSKLQ